MAAKVESFEKLSNKLAPPQLPCSENFQGVPSPADSGISVNSPVNPNLIQGDNLGQPNSNGELPPPGDQAAIPVTAQQTSLNDATAQQIQDILYNKPFTDPMVQQFLSIISSLPVISNLTNVLPDHGNIVVPSVTSESEMPMSGVVYSAAHR